MFSKKIFLIVGLLCGITFAGFAAELSGTVPVNVTSDTAMAAKNRAMNQARRQILENVLGNYANATAVHNAIANTESAELANLITSSSIAGEQVSDTSYSANITMVVDARAARDWLNGKDIQNWIVRDTESGYTFTVLVSMSDKMANWIDLNRVARDNGVDLATKYIVGNQAVLELPASARGGFINAIGATGWQHADQGDVLRIWK